MRVGSIFCKRRLGSPGLADPRVEPGTGSDDGRQRQPGTAEWRKDGTLRAGTGPSANRVGGVSFEREVREMPVHDPFSTAPCFTRRPTVFSNETDTVSAAAAG